MYEWRSIKYVTRSANVVAGILAKQAINVVTEFHPILHLILLIFYNNKEHGQLCRLLFNCIVVYYC